MLDSFEFYLKIIFLVLSIAWVGKIMILRSDKQIVINPALILIGSILAVLPQSSSNIEIFTVNIQTIRILLYCVYSFIVVFGIYTTNRKNGIF